MIEIVVAILIAWFLIATVDSWLPFAWFLFKIAIGIVSIIVVFTVLFLVLRATVA